MEHIGQQEGSHEQFCFPEVGSERGEIERVARIFSKDDPGRFVEDFFRAAENSQLVEISDAVWIALENTDSADIALGRWDLVEYHAAPGKRDWQTLRATMEQGKELDAPIVVKVGGVFHLVSGNTRLMVAKALGVRPKVLMVTMN